MNNPMLGATLYIPVTRKNLEQILRENTIGLRSVVVCLEDSVLDNEVEQAKKTFATFVANHRKPDDCRVYVRPRNIDMLTWMLTLPNIESIHGFVLPKVTMENMGQWLASNLHSEHCIMPTIEGIEAFDIQSLHWIRHQLTPFSDRVDAIRIGGNDILNMLGTRRSNVRTAYDGPLGHVIRNFVSAFIPYGFQVSSPVFEHFSNKELLKEEVLQDLEYGLLTKTAIHPDQVKQIHDLYKPTQEEVDEAKAILDVSAKAVFGRNGSMCEPATHRIWASNIMAQVDAFGIGDCMATA